MIALLAAVLPWLAAWFLLSVVGTCVYSIARSMGWPGFAFVNTRRKQSH